MHRRHSFWMLLGLGIAATACGAFLLGFVLGKESGVADVSDALSDMEGWGTVVGIQTDRRLYVAASVLAVVGCAAILGAIRARR